MYNGFIYLWTNKINGKKYIGSHIGTVDDGYTGSGKLFIRAVKKYGIIQFDRIILERVKSSKDVLIREQYYLDLYDAYKDKMFYNCNPRAGGGWEHYNNNPKYRKIFLKTQKEKWKIHPHPRGMLGKKHTKNTKKRMSESSIIASQTRKYNKSKSIIQLSLDNKPIRIFESMSEAARAMNGSTSNIKYTAEGKFKTAYGYKWKYQS